MKKGILLGAIVLVGFFLTACGPSQAELDSTATQIAHQLKQTQAASVPKPPPTLIPTSTLEPTATPTPMPIAVVSGEKVTVFEGPSTDFPALTEVSQGNTFTLIGHYQNCAWLKIITSDGLEGWVLRQPESLQLDETCPALPHGTFRALNGTILLDHRVAEGKGKFKTENGTANDGIIVLTDIDGRGIVAFYVRAGREYTLTGLPDGIYMVYFSMGRNWDGEDLRFTTSPSFEKFEEPFEYITKATKFTIWRITLHAIEGGAGETEAIPPEEFPPLG
jgi:hypothetical protein